MIFKQLRPLIAATLGGAVSFVLAGVNPASAAILGSTEGTFAPGTLFTRFSGTFSLDSAAPDLFPTASEVGIYNLTSFNFFFLDASGNLLANVSSTNTGGITDGDLFGVANNFPYQNNLVDGIGLRIDDTNNIGASLVESFSLATLLPQSLLNSDTIPIGLDITSNGAVYGDIDFFINKKIDSQNVDSFRLSITSVPTPALLPGLIGLGLGALRKRRQVTKAAQG